MTLEDLPRYDNAPAPTSADLLRIEAVNMSKTQADLVKELEAYIRAGYTYSVAYVMNNTFSGRFGSSFNIDISKKNLLGKNVDQPVNLAVTHKHYELALYLVSSGAEFSTSSFAAAIKNKAHSLLAKMLEKRKKVDFKHIDLSLNDLETLKVLLPYHKEINTITHAYNGYDVSLDYSKTVLGQAAMKGDVEIVKYIVSQGASISDHNAEAICKAVKTGQIEAADWMVDHALEHDKLEQIQLDRILWIASSVGELPTVKKLLELGARIKNSEGCALTVASNNKHSDVVQEIESWKMKEQQSAYPKWEKVDNHRLAEVSLLGETTQTCMRKVFDFSAKQVQSFMDSTGDLTFLHTQNFSEIESADGITQAFNKLVELGGAPQNYEPANNNKKTTQKAPTFAKATPVKSA